MQQGLTFLEGGGGGGGVHGQNGYKIFVFINVTIFTFTTFVKNTPLYGKIASKVWNIYFQYISPHFLDAAGGQISDLWLLLLSNSSLFSALMSHLPLLLLHSAMGMIGLSLFEAIWNCDKRHWSPLPRSYIGTSTCFWFWFCVWLRKWGFEGRRVLHKQYQEWLFCMRGIFGGS